MRPVAKADAVRRIRAAIEQLTETADTIEKAEPQNLLAGIGSGWWVDGRCTVNIGDTYHLTIIQARQLVAKLVAAIYCCEAGGNASDMNNEERERAFLDALKHGLSHALTEDAINAAVPPKWGVMCLEDGRWCGGSVGTEAHAREQLPLWISGEASALKPDHGFHYEAKPL